MNDILNRDNGVKDQLQLKKALHERNAMEVEALKNK